MRELHVASRRTRLSSAVALAMGLVAGSGVQAATALVVTAAGDAGTAGTCTLRQAIQALNMGTVAGTLCTPSVISGNVDRITFATATFPPAGSNTITLADAPDNVLRITAPNLTIDATANGQVTVERPAAAGNAFSILYFYPQPEGGKLTLSHITVRNGKLDAQWPFGAALGGGIASIYGDLELVDSTVSGNRIVTADYAAGGGIAVYAGNLTLTGSTVADNVVSGSSGVGGMGGGVMTRPNIYSHAGGDATIHASVISGNHAYGNAGGLQVGGALDIDATTITGNRAESAAGGIKTYGVTTVTDSTISNNVAVEKGGGIVAASGYYGVPAALVTIQSSTISGNRVTANGGNRGGGIYTRLGDLAISNSTLANNAATGDFGRGGGIYILKNDQPVTLQNVTVAGNTAKQRGGGIMIGTGGAGTINMWSTVFASSVDTGIDGRNLAVATGSVTVQGAYNLVYPAPSSTDNVLNVTFVTPLLPGLPQLTTLGHFGGQTATMLPQAGSALLDAVPAGATCPLAVDQRGQARPVGSACDIGAVELDAATVNDIIFRDGFDATAGASDVIFADGFDP